MPDPDSPWLRHHRQRWLRHDAHLWIRPDAARFFPPGTDPADINPTLPRKPDAAKAAAFEAEIEAGYQLLAVLRAEVASLRAELKRRRELEQVARMSAATCGETSETRMSLRSSGLRLLF
jgi:hypothetical protein